jgi:pimeloyl-ACP methyl ester carboxylesterase
MSELERHVVLPDGRRLGYARFGHPGGPPVLYFHGFPASRLEAGILEGAAARLGVSLTAPDRPGFGLSDFQPGRAILDWPRDVLHLADALGLDRFAVVGGSGGCPFAAACAHRIPHRLVRVATVAGLAPTSEAALSRPMGRAARLGFFLARRTPSLFNLVYGALGHMVARWPGVVFHLHPVTPPDREVLARADVRAILTNSVQEAFRQGPAGALHELGLLARPWGFRLEDIPTAVDLWHGRQDATVPPAMGEFLAARVPNARLRLLAGEGHISLAVRHGTEIMEALLSPSA